MERGRCSAAPELATLRAMPESRFRLAIPAERYLSYYAGAARSVVVTAADGKRIQFPAERLRPFVTSRGIYGEFVLEYDGSNRLTALRRVGD